MRWRTKKMISRKKARARKVDKKTNINNKNLMIDKILSYSPMLVDGVEKYIDAKRNFWLLIFLGALLRDFIFIALPCSLLAMFFSIRMFQFIKYKNINNIVNELAKDISFKGVYDENKVDMMVNNFRDKYGEDSSEYYELTNMLNNYKTFVMKIESILKNLDTDEQQTIEQVVVNEDTIKSLDQDNIKILKEPIENTKIKDAENYERSSDDNLSLIYKNNDGKVKKINRAIEFFYDEDGKSYENKNAVVLKNSNNKNDKLTVYLYKKTVDFQKNAL